MKYDSIFCIKGQYIKSLNPLEENGVHSQVF